MHTLVRGAMIKAQGQEVALAAFLTCTHRSHSYRLTVQWPQVPSLKNQWEKVRQQRILHVCRAMGSAAPGDMDGSPHGYRFFKNPKTNERTVAAVHPSRRGTDTIACITRLPTAHPTRGCPPEHDAVHADGPLPVLQGRLASQVHELLRADHMLIILWREAQQGRVRGAPLAALFSCLSLVQSPAWGWGVQDGRA